MNLRFRFITLAAFFAISIASADQNEAAVDNPLIQRTLEYAQGHQEFKNLFYKNHEADFVNLVKYGQSPKTLFIGCSDSRVIPELISFSNPGELFVVRNAGNFVPYHDLSIMWDGVAASIEYAVEMLGVTNIIVCGHSHCGAIEGLFKDIKQPTIAHWLRFGHEAKRVTLLALGEKVENRTKYNVAEHLSVLFQLDHLLTYPYIKEKVQLQTLYLHGWYFDIESGSLEYYDPDKAKFMPMSSLVLKPIEK